MIQKVQQYKTLDSFTSNPRKKTGYVSYRYHQIRESERKEAIRSVVGATVGTAIPLLLFAKKQNVNPFKLKYGIKELIGVSSGAIAGGTFAGMLGENKKDNIQKAKEGVFQFMNASIPPLFAAGLIKMTEKTKVLNNIAGRAAAILTGLAAGMFAAVKLSNIVCDPKDKEPDRKLTMLDSLANVDDALGILALTNNPIINKLPISQVLPFIYVFCGYRAGSSN